MMKVGVFDNIMQLTCCIKCTDFYLQCKYFYILHIQFQQVYTNGNLHKFCYYTGNIILRKLLYLSVYSTANMTVQVVRTCFLRLLYSKFLCFCVQSENFMLTLRVITVIKN
jgi:hypothetical protein